MPHQSPHFPESQRIQVRQLLVPGMTAEQALERLRSLGLRLDNQASDEPVPLAVMEGALRAARRRRGRVERSMDVYADFRRSSLAGGEATTDMYKLIARRRMRQAV